MALNELPDKIEKRATNLAHSIFRQPYGFLVIVLCIAVFYLFKENQSLREENKELQMDYITTLKKLGSELKEITDTTKSINHVSTN